MELLDRQDLEYGILYVIGNPKLTHNLRWFASMIGPMIRPLSLQWVETWDCDHTIIAARRFNVGNLGKYATVQLHLNRYGSSDSFSLLAALHAFSDCLQDVMDVSEGDVHFREADYNDRNEPPKGKWGRSDTPLSMGDILYDIVHPQDKTRIVCDPVIRPTESTPEPHKKAKRRNFSMRGRNWRGLRNILIESDEDMLLEEDESDLSTGSSETYSKAWTDSCEIADRADVEAADEVLDVEAEDVREFKRIESEYERDVRELRAHIVMFIAKYHQDPQEVMTKLLEGKVLLGSSPGHLLVNGDLKIVLPDYDELEIKMPAMCRTLYILFMKRRKQGGGIVLRDIQDYCDEILDIYCMVKPGANETRVEQSVANLCDPLGNSLNQMISRINRCVRNVITDQHLAEQYIISGTRGEEYSISLSPDYMTLPRAVMG